MEGQFDVITAHQFGVQNAVASSGTALTDDQVRLLKRFTDELLLVFDSDRAGREAARQGGGAGGAARDAHPRRDHPGRQGPGRVPAGGRRGGGESAGRSWSAAAPSGFEFWIKDAGSSGLNPSNPNHLEMRWPGPRGPGADPRVPARLRRAIAERAERWLGVPPHLLSRSRHGDGRSGRRRRGGLRQRFNAGVAGKKVTVARYLLQLLAVRPVAFERVRTKLTPEELDEEDRGMYVRMLETYERGGRVRARERAGAATPRRNRT